jgi:hypothetical protein
MEIVKYHMLELCLDIRSKDEGAALLMRECNRYEIERKAVSESELKTV